jgi:hypothetical protein
MLLVLVAEGVYCVWCVYCVLDVVEGANSLPVLVLVLVLVIVLVKEPLVVCGCRLLQKHKKEAEKE